MMYEKLEAKMTKRVGMKVTTLDNMKVCTITNFVIKGDEATGYTVLYMVVYKDVYGGHTIRLVKESDVVLMKEPNN